MYSYVVFRMDDICPQMDYNRFMRFKVLFDRYDIKPIIGVIPDNRDPALSVSNTDGNFWNMVQELNRNGWIIAQHGYQHVYTTKAKGLVALRNESEFAGLPYEKQFSMIKKGKEILSDQGLETDIFMAPGNSFDRTTLIALKDCGFKYITDGRSNYPYEYMGLKFIPAKCSSPKVIKGLNTVYIHSNTTTDKLFTKIEDFISKHREKIKNFDEILNLEPKNYYYCRMQELFNIFYYKCIVNQFYPVYKAIKPYVQKLRKIK
ncbi:MAG TPA: DUF2334 domain-containing protein [Clostridiaceae bacterium]|nr:DUF2334 domain-containing protein [Clostridiaceae bacterium]